MVDGNPRKSHSIEVSLGYPLCSSVPPTFHEHIDLVPHHPDGEAENPLFSSSVRDTVRPLYDRPRLCERGDSRPRARDRMETP